MVRVLGEASGGARDQAGESNYVVRVMLWGREFSTYLNLDFMLWALATSSLLNFIPVYAKCVYGRGGGRGMCVWV